jgi:transposase
VLEGAGWHKSKDFIFPDNLRLLFLPPYSPELNPQEHLWDELREKYFHNRVFAALTPSKIIGSSRYEIWKIGQIGQIASKQSPHGIGLLIPFL